MSELGAQRRDGGVLSLLIARGHAAVSTAGELALMVVEVVVVLCSFRRARRLALGELVTQAWFVVRVSVVPTLLVTLPFGVIVSIQVGSIAQQIGATSFVGAANGLGIVRQGAPIVVALLLAGAVGSAICSDLGTRAIRDEIAALQVMGVRPVPRLVAPRVVATVLVAMLLCGVVAFAGLVTGLLFNLVAQGGTPGAYLASFTAFAGPADLLLAEAKSAVFGALVAVVACHKGLRTDGGPRGVADSVNATVVLSVVLLFAVNLAVTEASAVLGITERM